MVTTAMGALVCARTRSRAAARARARPVDAERRVAPRPGAPAASRSRETGGRCRLRAREVDRRTGRCGECSPQGAGAAAVHSAGPGSPGRRSRWRGTGRAGPVGVVSARRPSCCCWPCAWRPAAGAPGAGRAGSCRLDCAWGLAAAAAGPRCCGPSRRAPRAYSAGHYGADLAASPGTPVVRPALGECPSPGCRRARGGGRGARGAAHVLRAGRGGWRSATGGAGRGLGPLAHRPRLPLRGGLPALGAAPGRGLPGPAAPAGAAGAAAAGGAGGCPGCTVRPGWRRRRCAGVRRRPRHDESSGALRRAGHAW